MEVIDVTVNLGKVHDRVAFNGLHEELIEKHSEIDAVVADAGYKLPLICKQITDNGMTMSLPYKRPTEKDGFFRPSSTFMMNIMIVSFSPITGF